MYLFDTYYVFDIVAFRVTCIVIVHCVYIILCVTCVYIAYALCRTLLETYVYIVSVLYV